MVWLIFSQDPQTAGKSCNYPRTKHPLQLRVENSPGCRAPGLGALKAGGPGPHCSLLLPSTPPMALPAPLLTFSGHSPTSETAPSFPAVPSPQTGNADGFTLLQELSSPRDPQLILRASRQARASTASQSSQIHEQTTGISTGPGFLQCPALPPTSAHSSHKSNHPQGAPGIPHTSVTAEVHCMILCFKGVLRRAGPETLQ